MQYITSKYDRLDIHESVHRDTIMKINQQDATIQVNP